MLKFDHLSVCSQGTGKTHGGQYLLQHPGLRQGLTVKAKPPIAVTVVQFSAKPVAIFWKKRPFFDTTCSPWLGTRPVAFGVRNVSGYWIVNGVNPGKIL